MESEYKTAWGKIAESPDFRRRAERIQRQRAGIRQRMNRKTHVMRERFVWFGEKFLLAFGLRAKKRKATANPIPARLRPWTPRNMKCSPDEAYRLLFKLREVCTKEQYKYFEQRYSYLWQRAGVNEW
jgi:hypothetical protein